MRDSPKQAVLTCEWCGYNSLKTRLVRTFIINHSKGDFDLSTKLVMKLFIHSFSRRFGALLRRQWNWSGMMLAMVF